MHFINNIGLDIASFCGYLVSQDINFLIKEYYVTLDVSNELFKKNIKKYEINSKY